MSSPDHTHQNEPVIIAATLHGVVRSCRDCGALHFRFGNAVLSLSCDDLAQLRAAVANSPKRRQSRDACSASPSDAERCVDLYLGESGVGFTFSPAELRELDVLLADAARAIVAESWDSAVDRWALAASATHRPARFPNARS